MAQTPHNPDSGGLPEAFVESLESYIFGVISIEQIRRRIASLLSENQDWGPAMLTTIDSAYNKGHLNGTAYRTLITEIDLGTSEDEPTEWSEETRAEFGDEAPAPEAEPPEDTELPELTSAVEAVHIEPGELLGHRYLLLEKIGTGSMGDVYKALDREREAAGSTEPWVAVKIVSQEFSRNPNALEALKQEAAHGERLLHPNIIRVFDFDWDGDQFFMTMEWLQGSSLVDLLNTRRFQPLPTEQAHSIIQGLCHGLSHAHAQGIVHSDVKPGNIFVTQAGHTKLLDFGIARVVADIPVEFDATGIGAHTPAYSSCEVLEGEVPEPADDVYSLACVAYRLLAGRRAYGGATALDAEARNVELQPIPSLDDAQWRALKGALALRRIHRTPDVASFLAEFSNQATVDMTRPMPQPPPGEFVERRADNRGLPLKIAVPAIAATLAAIAFVLWWPDQPAQQRPVMPQPEGQEPVLDEIVPVAQRRPELVRETVEPVPEPVERQPETERYDTLLDAANQRMDNGQLVEPVDDSARSIIAELETLDADTPELQQARLRLANLMLLEAMVAITDERFSVAEDWIDRTRDLGVPESMTGRYETELEEARQAKAARASETLSAIFASATPAAILADPDVSFEPDAPAPALAMVLPGTAARPAGEPAELPTEASEPEPEEELTPLSALEFRHFVKPEHPPGTVGKTAGWVEVRFDVDEKGRTTDVHVVAAEPAGVFDKAATSAIRRWRFRPYRVDGRPTATASGVRLRFKAN